MKKISIIKPKCHKYTFYERIGSVFIVVLCLGLLIVATMSLIQTPKVQEIYPHASNRRVSMVKVPRHPTRSRTGSATLPTGADCPPGYEHTGDACAQVAGGRAQEQKKDALGYPIDAFPRLTPAEAPAQDQSGCPEGVVCQK